MNTFSELWGVRTPAEAQAKIQAQKDSVHLSGQPKNLEEQAISLIGTDIYKKLIKGYTEKQWGQKATDLPAFIIRRLPVRYTYDNNYFNDTYQGIPIGGYTQIVEKMLDHPEIDVQTGVDFFADKDEYERLKDSFILDERLMALGKPSMIVLHPLPRVNEITVGVDKDPRAAYFRQVENGKYVRKAIIYTLLSDEYLHAEPTGHQGEASISACHNDRCIATTEPVEQKAYIDKDGVKRCFYCDHML